MKFKVSLLIGVMLVFLGFMAPAFSQEDAAPAPAATEESSSEEKETVIPDRSMFSYIQDGGWMGYIIIGLSVLGFTLGIENFVSLNREKLVPPEIVDELERLFDEENFEGALELCESEDCFLTRIVSAGLARAAAGYDAIIESMGEVGEQEATQMHQKVGWLSLIANMAPMMGLLGTVTGMISAFTVIANDPNPNASKLAGGIQQALMTTCLGLIVAIPIMFLFAFLRNKVVKVVLEAGMITTELMERFRPEE